MIKSALVLVVVGAVALLAVAVVLPKLKPSGPPHPDEWDPRVADIADWVQMERGLDFDHPVYVDFLNADQYSKFIRANEPTGKDAEAEAKAEGESLEDLVGWYRALALLEGEHDLAEAFDDMYDSGSLALYSPVTDRVTVRGTKMTPALKVTLAHELTHALQDQHYDLERLDTFTGVQREAFRAVVEGDADRIEAVYLEKELAPDERLLYEKENDDAAALAEVALAETVPDIVLTGFSSAYTLGGAFVEVLDQVGGNTAINEALKDPIETDEQLFDPFAYLEHEARTEVDAPKAAKGAEVLDEGELGVTVLYVLLTSRIDAKEALAAIDGWGGDASLISRRDGKICVDLVVVGEDEATTALLGSALRRWSEATPGDHDRVEVTAETITVATCDPGPDAGLAITPDVGRFLLLPQYRSYVAAAVIEEGGSQSEAQCFSEAIAAEVDFGRLEAEEGYVDSMEYQQLLGRVRTACVE